MKIYRIFLALLIWAGVSGLALAQQPPVRLSTITNYLVISPYTELQVDSSGTVALNKPLETSTFIDLGEYLASHPPRKHLIHRYYLRFGVLNNRAIPDTMYLYLGPQETVKVWEQGLNGQSAVVASSLRPFNAFLEVELFALPLQPGEQASFLVEVEPRKLYALDLVPVLIPKRFVDYFFYQHIVQQSTFLPYLLTFMGMLFMMFSYVVAKAIQVKSMAYAYYAGYVACFLGYFTFKAFGLASVELARSPWFYSYLNNMLPVAAYALYFPFVRHILDLKKNAPWLNLYFVFSTYFQFFYAFIDAGLISAGDAYFPLRWLIWDATRLLLIVATVFSSIIILRLKNPIGYYVVSGGVAIAAFGLVALLTSNNQTWVHHLALPLNQPLFYFLMGIGIELICFSFAIAYKNRLDIAEKIQAQENLKFEREREAFELYKAVAKGKESERRRISGEMHDDIGSGLTSIMFLGNRLAAQVQAPQAKITTGRILDLASDLVDKMNDIIWSMNPQNDTLDNLVAYIRQQAATQLENAGLNYKFEIAELIPALAITGEKRRNIYLTVKEAVNNVVKHAQADHVTIAIKLNGHLQIEIRDNGKGMAQPTGRKFGNGLRNMEQRMIDIRGTFDLRSDGGTTIVLTAPSN